MISGEIALVNLDFIIHRGHINKIEEIQIRIEFQSGNFMVEKDLANLALFRLWVSILILKLRFENHLTGKLAIVKQ